MVKNAIRSNNESISRIFKWWDSLLSIHGYLNNLKYYYGVLFNKAEKYMQFYKYEDIQSVELILNHRYESYGTPIAKDWYVLDYRFEFKDGNHFYFYWPLLLMMMHVLLEWF